MICWGYLSLRLGALATGGYKLMLNPQIPLSGQAPSALNTYMATEQHEQGTERNRLLNLLTAEQNKSVKGANEEDEMRREGVSLARGAYDTLDYLQKKDVAGLEQYYTQRREEILRRGGNPRDTESALELLKNGNLGELQSRAKHLIDVTTNLGYIKPPARFDPNALNQLRDVLPEENVPTFDAFAAVGPNHAVDYSESILRPTKPLVNINNSPAGAGLTQEQKALADTRVKRFESIQTDAQAAISQNEQLTQLSQIQVGAGFGEGAKVQLARVFNSFGANGDALLGVDAANAQAFNAVSGKLLAEALAAQKGPQTDRDANRMMDTLPKLTNEQEANKFIIGSMQAINDRKVEQAEFYERILEETGSLSDADKRWREFKERTPMVSDSLIDPGSGLPMFFRTFAQEVKRRNPSASRQQIIQAWREKNSE